MVRWKHQEATKKATILQKANVVTGVIEGLSKKALVVKRCVSHKRVAIYSVSMV